VSSLFTLGCRLRAAVVLLWLLQMTGIQAQQSPALHPPDYPGVRTFIPGVFVTPVPGAPFSGTVEIVSRQSMSGAQPITSRATLRALFITSGGNSNPQSSRANRESSPRTSTIPRRASALSSHPIRTLCDRWFFRGHPSHLRIVLPIRRLPPETRKISRRRIWEQRLWRACCCVAPAS
jgi:hypothetical protein